MYKFRFILFWLVVSAYALLALGFVSVKKEQVECDNIEVFITDDTENYFIEKEDVVSLLQMKGKELIGTPMEEIDVNELENIISSDPSIKNAEVYTKIDGSVLIEVEQRNPIVRVINYNDESYYIDDQGAMMPLSDKYTAHVLIANGHINEPYDLLYTTDVTMLGETDELGRKYVIKDVYEVAHFINISKFWRSMIEQIYVNEDGDLELIPRVGQHVVIFGTSEDCYEKFRKLEIMYKTGLNMSGWNKYKTINLKYNNQVVCTKK